MTSGCSTAGSSFFHDPVAYAQAARQQSLEATIQFSVAAVGQQSAKQVGEAMAALVEAAAQLGKELGKGMMFDATA